MLYRHLGRGGVLCVVLAAAARADLHFDLVRSIPVAQAKAWPTYSDYNGDGVDDIAVTGNFGSLIQLASGTNGAILRTITGESQGFGSVVQAVGDATGDGRNEIVIADPVLDLGTSKGEIYTVKSQFAGGLVTNAGATVFTRSAPVGLVGYGNAMSATPGRLWVAAPDYSRVDVLNSSTGAVQAQLKGKTSDGLGNVMADVGDVNGDGIHDMALGDPRQGSGEIYIINGTVQTATVTAVNALPAGSVLATIQGAGHSGQNFAVNASIGPILANLGDPRPGNGVNEQLIVVGTPFAGFQSGAFSAFLLTSNGAGGYTSSEVAFGTSLHPAPHNDLGFGVVPVGDVNGDGVGDVAIEEWGGFGAYAEPNLSAGDIMIVSGAGLLDGFGSSDVLQTIFGSTSHPFQGYLQDLGDYDHNGSRDFMITSDVAMIYSAVPEPASLTVLAAGGVLGLMRRRTRKAAKGWPVLPVGK